MRFGDAVSGYVELDEIMQVATLVASDNQPGSLLAASYGNAQTIDDGNLFVGWGSLPYSSASDATGKLIFNAQFLQGVNSYPRLLPTV